MSNYANGESDNLVLDATISTDPASYKQCSLDDESMSITEIKKCNEKMEEDDDDEEDDDCVFANITTSGSPNTDTLHMGSSSVSSQEQQMQMKPYDVDRPNSLLPRPGNSVRKLFAVRSKRHSSRTNLYIRGLPKSMGENDLVNLVPDASAIRSVKLVVNNDGEGYGFIDFISNEAAVVAMQHIKSQNANQYVNFAYESEKDPLNVYVTNIPEAWNSDNVENLKQIFSPYGKITSALVMTRRSTNTCTGTGFVRYLTSEDAQKAIDGIRKAKITLPGARRPLELKLADRQRAREHKSESGGSESSTIPLFQQFMRDDMHLNRVMKGASNQVVVEDIFTECANRIFVNGSLQNFDPLSVLPVNFTTTANDLEVKLLQNHESYAQGKFTPLMNHHHSPSDGVVVREHFLDATLPQHQSAGTQAQGPDQSPTSHLPVVQIPSLAPIYQFSCIPWIQDAVTSATYIHPQATALTAQKALLNGNPSAGAGVTGLDLASLAFNIGLSQPNVNYGQLPFELVLPILSNLNEQLIEAANLYPFGMNQPALWPKACFHG